MSLVCLVTQLIGADFCLNADVQGTQEIKCPVEVYLYLDVSASLEDQADDLEQGLQSFVSKKDNIFPPGTNIYVIPFADQASRHSPFGIQTNEQVSDIMSKWRNQDKEFFGGLDRNKTNLTALFNDIFIRLDMRRKSTVEKPYIVIVIASDLKHDPSPGKILDAKEDWDTSFGESLVEKYRTSFSRGADQSLLLLHAGTESDPVVQGVLGDLIRPNMQVAYFKLGRLVFDSTLFLSYIQPMDVDIERAGSFRTKTASVTIRAHNRSCLIVGDQLLYELSARESQGKDWYALANFGKLQRNSGAREWTATQEIREQDVDKRLSLYKLDEPDASYQVKIFQTGKIKPTSKPLGSTTAHTSNNLHFLSLRGALDAASGKFDGELNVGGDLAGPTIDNIDLTIVSNGRVAGGGRAAVTGRILREGGSLEPKDLTIWKREMLEDICLHKSPHVVLSLSDDQGLLPGGEGRRYPLWVGNGRGEPEKLLREIFEQASFPAFFTSFFGLILLWNSAGEIERVEKVLAVLALGMTTMFVLLHHLTLAETYMDFILEVWWIRAPMAVGTVFWFMLLAIRIFQQGGLPLPPSDGEIAAELAEESSSNKREVSEDKSQSFWNLRVALITGTLFVSAVVAGMVIYGAKSRAECVIQVYAPSQPTNR